MQYDCVLEGGGVKIPGLVGAMAAIEERDFTPSHLAGTSAGSIVAALRAAGYRPHQLKQIMLDIDFKQFLDGNGFGRKSYNILRHRGIYKGDAFYQYMKEMLEDMGVRTFGDLKSRVIADQHTSKWRHRLKGS